MRAIVRALIGCVALVLLMPCGPAASESEPLPIPPRSTAGSHGGTAVLLSRVYPAAARDDEFVELANVGLQAVDVSGWYLTDGEATATFPLDAILPPKGRLLVTRNSTSYAEDTLAAADFAFESGSARRMEGGVPRLADTGDEVRLFDAAARLVDAYVWGDTTDDGPGWAGRPAERTGRGEIAVRAVDGLGSWIDTDAASDWEGVRHHRLGQSSFGASDLEIRGRVTAVLSPDAADEILLSFLASARERVDVAVYTFTSDRIAAVLAHAAGRGIHVRVLVDGGPVGGVEADEIRIVSGLLGAGAEVRWLSGNADVVKRYRYLHAKYAVVDGTAAWIGSENFGFAGYPAGPEGGNRGWSVVIEDERVAVLLARVFESDFDPRRRDSVPAEQTVFAPLPALPVTPWPTATGWAPRRGRLLIAPDTSFDPEGLLGLLESAQDRIRIEAFYVDETWRDRPNPFLEVAFAAARRGVSVRILIDGSWWSVGDDSTGNDRIVDRLNRRARNESADLEARLFEPRGRIERLHNKGIVVDGRAVLVSSMNWALGSATENREIGILLDDLEIARFFEAAFDADWDGRPTSGIDAWRLEDPLLLLGVYAFVGVASAVSLRKLRVGAKGIKPRAGVRRRGASGARLRGRPGEVRLLPAELVAQPRARPGGRRGARRGREEARGRVRGPPRD